MTDHPYLIKYLTTEMPFTAKYLELYAQNPRDAADTFAQLVPHGVVIDVFFPPVSPEEWVTTSASRKKNGPNTKTTDQSD